MTQASAACGGDSLPVGCVAIVAPTPADAASLRRVLAGLPPLWRPPGASDRAAGADRRSAPPLAPSVNETPAEYLGAPAIAAVLVAWLLLASLLGAAAAALVRAVAPPATVTRRSAVAAGLRAGSAVALAAAVPTTLVWSGRVGLWDAVAVTTVAAAVAVLWLDPATAWRRAARIAFGTLLGLVILEVALQVIDWPHPIVPPERSLPITLAPGGLAARLVLAEPGYCVPWQGGVLPDSRCRAPPVPTERPVVLHIGDSNLAGTGVDPQQRFTALLRSRGVEFVHLNTGLGGTSVDVQAHVARQWLRRLPVAAIVLHAYACNDLEEIHRRRLWCRGESPLVRRRGQVELRCERPDPASDTPRVWLRYSPPPFPMLVLARWSALSAVAVAWFNATATADPNMSDAAAEAGYADGLQVLLKTAAKANVPVAAVLMPIRDDLCGPHGRAHHQTLRRMLTAAQVPFLDMAPSFDATVRRLGAAARFVEVPAPDPHPNAAGHEAIAAAIAAAWPTLLPTLRPDAPTR